MPSPKPKKKSVPARPAPPPQAAAAFEGVEPEMLALEKDDLWAINIDIPQAVSIALGALPGLRELRPAIAKQLPEYDLAQFDKLETYALAAWFAHLLSLPVGGSSNPTKPLIDEAIPLKANLLRDADALVGRGLIDGKIVDQIRAGQGHMDLANDLVALSALFSQAWARIQGKTAATPEDIHRAGELGPLLLAALGVREHGPAPGPSEVADRRVRAATLFLRAYDQARRAVIYLRWDEEDADEIAPSLYKGRGGRGAAKGGSRGGQTAPTEGAGTQPAAPKEG